MQKNLEKNLEKKIGKIQKKFRKKFRKNMGKILKIYQFKKNFKTEDRIVVKIFDIS